MDDNGAIGMREAKSAFFTDCVKNALFAPQYPHSEVRYRTKIWTCLIEGTLCFACSAKKIQNPLTVESICKTV